MLSDHITKEEFLALTNHRQFRLPVFEAVSPPTTIACFNDIMKPLSLYFPYGTSVIETMHPYPCPAYFSASVHDKVSKVLFNAEDDITWAHKRYWQRLTEALSQDEWDQFWAGHPYRAAVVRALLVTGIRADGAGEESIIATPIPGIRVSGGEK